ncbi:MAG TPA: superoxide dismutase [Saprospiraceae bacterium]|nr:superoxide dismutase [Saprospiraceae bacterium]
MAFKLPELPYDYDALEPQIDTRTMEIHHQKHHAGYTKKLNAAIEGTDLATKTIRQILEEVSKHSAAVRNNAGGYFNHDLFWNILSPNGGGVPDDGTDIHQRLVQAFGTYEGFKDEFTKAATGQFGSGWAWLCVHDPVGNLFITSTPNQDNPLMDDAPNKGIPILGLDVWEHAYYLKYQNKRPDYVNAFYDLINWPEVNTRYQAAKKEAALI